MGSYVQLVHLLSIPQTWPYWKKRGSAASDDVVIYRKVPRFLQVQVYPHLVGIKISELLAK